MAFLELQELTKSFGKTRAVERISLGVERGEFLTLLGPSGCGKTTVLRLVAGFEQPDAGHILLDQEEITTRPANRRPMGMVFQSYALFPHMTAEQNVAFGLRLRRLPPALIRQRCEELLALVGLAERARSYPHQLSGGQQQRVALARALAVEPKVLLLDEPLSALDAAVRVTLREEIRRIQQQLGMTVIYVTHDQEEALAISGRIAVMARGRLEQLGTPEEIYRRPRTVFVAGFVGASTRLSARLERAVEGRCRLDGILLRVPPQPELSDGSAVLLVVRPELVTLCQLNEASGAAADGGGQRQGQENVLLGTVELRTFLGAVTRFRVRAAGGQLFTVDLPGLQAGTLVPGQRVRLSFPPEACLVLPLEETGSGVTALPVPEWPAGTTGQPGPEREPQPEHA
ncbi:ABC transporter ATP-binding protein [Thermogemmatispora tikiterensis]|uniref:ABC-type quaternary amine transporter n=1 Tax=Thermogemmatispora tikiterensis TaxID=1825093 RepID=A0A328VT69_9CHLR|nr:ABC transporter ATP-binding protein [Thermogemmatispora tikiterensis]RAQ98484.1 spermidine/putrescine ABC transporter ATP-binding protein [Thermogemmatispora tikiterensis]